MTIRIDNGQGSGTPGKSSTDGPSVNNLTPVKSRAVWFPNFPIAAMLPGFSFLTYRISHCRNAATGCTQSVMKSARPMSYSSQFTSMLQVPIESGTPHQAGAHTLLMESPAQIFLPLTFMKPHESIWLSREYTITTARRNPISETTSMCFATANAMQYSKKIFTKIAASMWFFFKAVQEKGLLLCST